MEITTRQNRENLEIQLRSSEIYIGLFTAAHVGSLGLHLPSENKNNMQDLISPYFHDLSRLALQYAESLVYTAAGSLKSLSGHDGDPTTDVVDEHVYLLPSLAET